jgi:hypothetical protein
LYSSICSGRGVVVMLLLLVFMANFSLSVSRYYSCVVVLALLTILLLLLLLQVLLLLLLSLKTQLLSVSKASLETGSSNFLQRVLSTCVEYSLNTIKTPKFCIRCITIPSILNNWYCHSRIQSSTIVAFSLINEIGHNFDT